MFFKSQGLEAAFLSRAHFGAAQLRHVQVGEKLVKTSNMMI
jgi:hypothetical protein